MVKRTNMNVVKGIAHLLIIFSTVLVLTSGSSITGAAVGSTASTSFRVVLGFVGLALGLVLTKFKKNFDKEVKT